MLALEGSGGFILLLFYILSGIFLVRVFRAKKLPGWLERSELNREYLLLTHMVLLIVALSMIIDAWF